MTEEVVVLGEVAHVHDLGRTPDNGPMALERTTGGRGGECHCGRRNGGREGQEVMVVVEVRGNCCGGQCVRAGPDTNLRVGKNVALGKRLRVFRHSINQDSSQSKAIHSNRYKCVNPSPDYKTKIDDYNTVRLETATETKNYGRFMSVCSQIR